MEDTKTEWIPASHFRAAGIFLCPGWADGCSVKKWERKNEGGIKGVKRNGKGFGAALTMFLSCHWGIERKNGLKKPF